MMLIMSFSCAEYDASHDRSYTNGGKEEQEEDSTIVLMEGKEGGGTTNAVRWGERDKRDDVYFCTADE